MPGVCRNIDIAGGLLIATQSTVKANGNNIWTVPITVWK